MLSIHVIYKSMYFLFYFRKFLIDYIKQTSNNQLLRQGQNVPRPQVKEYLNARVNVTCDR